MTYLITGGAGFIGQHLSRALLSEGHKIRILDNFSPQIHGGKKNIATDLSDKVEVFYGDVRDKELLIKAIDGVDGIVHLAAETGTGQSMYEIERYFSVNVQGTAILLDILQNHPVASSIKSIVVASSRAIYGEGAYSCATHGLIYPNTRNVTKLETGDFDPYCPICGSSLNLESTTETSPFQPLSMYGLTKQIQEQAVLMLAHTKGINAFALRYQNVYGPGQSLKNPYTGILAVFSTLARQKKSIEVYEDGLESRDFVYIDDVVEATVRAISYSDKFIGSVNVGSGVATNVLTVANEINGFFGGYSTIATSGAFRIGDIRHNKADLSVAKNVLKFEPKVFFKEGINRFLTWAINESIEDGVTYDHSVKELTDRGLMGRSKTKNHA